MSSVKVGDYEYSGGAGLYLHLGVARPIPVA